MNCKIDDREFEKSKQLLEKHRKELQQKRESAQKVKKSKKTGK